MGLVRPGRAALLLAAALLVASRPPGGATPTTEAQVVAAHRPAAPAPAVPTQAPPSGASTERYPPTPVPPPTVPVTPPPTPTPYPAPHPSAAPATALCASTRGQPVEVAGRRVPLDASLCVSVDEPGRLRVQVVGGRSFVEVDPATGREVGGSLVWEEVALFGHLEAVSGTPLPRTTPPPPPRVLPTRDPNAPTRTTEEELSMRATHVATAEAGGLREIAVSGPETMGSTIHVGGRRVQLPEDAYVEHYIVTVLCVAGERCPEAPFYTLRRGASSVSVSVPSGRVVDRRIAPDEPGAFDFLEGAPR